MIQFKLVHEKNPVRYEDELNAVLEAMQSTGYYVTHVKSEVNPDGFYAFIFYSGRKPTKRQPSSSQSK